MIERHFQIVHPGQLASPSSAQDLTNTPAGRRTTPAERLTRNPACYDEHSGTILHRTARVRPSWFDIQKQGNVAGLIFDRKYPRNRSSRKPTPDELALLEGGRIFSSTTSSEMEDEVPMVPVAGNTVPLSYRPARCGTRCGCCAVRPANFWSIDPHSVYTTGSPIKCSKCCSQLYPSLLTRAQPTCLSKSKSRTSS